MDNLADAQSLTEIEQEKEEEKERTRSIRRSKSKTPEKDGQVMYLLLASRKKGGVTKTDRQVMYLLFDNGKVGGGGEQMHGWCILCWIVGMCSGGWGGGGG